METPEAGDLPAACPCEALSSPPGSDFMLHIQFERPRLRVAPGLGLAVIPCTSCCSCSKALPYTSSQMLLTTEHV